jgi:tetratricopeptide (TPR) repeat protein
MRFLKGVIQAESGHRAEAIEIYTQLTQEYPELAEPYNNLAVLYAQQEQYDKAREALEGAVRANPGYATAYENLGDVYAKLASQSYAKAQQLEPGNATATGKLALVKQLLANPQKR